MYRTIPLLCFALFACAREADEPDVAEPATATANLVARSGSNVTGAVTLQADGQNVKVIVNATGLTPGAHGIHVHEIGDCTSPDAESAGPHFAGKGARHGPLGDEMSHAGDLGNIMADADGKASIEIPVPNVDVDSLIGRAIVIHAERDDLESQPGGGSGTRIACGVISRRAL